jgi:hypothetical protein
MSQNKKNQQQRIPNSLEKKKDFKEVTWISKA